MKWLLALLSLTLCSCSGLQTQQNENQMSAWFNQRIGTEAKGELVKIVGAPHDRMETDKLEIWTYVFAGQAYQTNNGFQGNQPGVVNVGFGMSNVYQHIERLTCAWDVDGKLVWWRYDR